MRRILGNGAPPAAADLRSLEHAGEHLPGWYEDWVVQARDQLRQRRLLALDAAADALIAARCYADATLTALAAVAVDPLRETASRLLIRSYLGAGTVAISSR